MRNPHPMRKKKEPLPYIEILRRLAHAGVTHSPAVNRITGYTEDMASLRDRVDFLIGVVNQQQRKATDMLFFIMYDIESNMVRREIAKYLEDKGCFRIQKSIFLASADRSVFEQIKSDLADVQALYDNHDSIILCPVSTDETRAMKVIGQELNIDIITQTNNTLFF